MLLPPSNRPTDNKMPKHLEDVAKPIHCRPYYYFSILERLNVVSDHALNQPGVVSLFFITKMGNNYFQVVRRRCMLYLCTQDSKPHYLDYMTNKFLDQIEYREVVLTTMRTFNTYKYIFV